MDPKSLTPGQVEAFVDAGGVPIIVQLCAADAFKVSQERVESVRICVQCILSVASAGEVACR